MKQVPVDSLDEARELVDNDPWAATLICERNSFTRTDETDVSERTWLQGPAEGPWPEDAGEAVPEDRVADALEGTPDPVVEVAGED